MGVEARGAQREGVREGGTAGSRLSHAAEAQKSLWSAMQLRPSLRRHLIVKWAGWGVCGFKGVIK